jgi:hypothetical protein
MSTQYAWTPYPPTACVRRAWLTSGGSSLDLDKPAAGYFCTELVLGSPTVREVVSNRPDQDGVDDRTLYFGSRAISAKVVVLAGAGARIDDVADNFAPYMVPSLRTQLHVILDRPGAAERIATVRAASYQWVVAGDNQREVMLQWVAADPYFYDPTTQTVIAWAGSSTANGRTYDLTFARTYPSGAGATIMGTIRPAGDLPIQPLIRIYGPITAPRVGFACYDQTGAYLYRFDIYFVSGFTLTAGQWVDVDTDRHTAYRQSDTTQSVFASINFGSTTWPTLPVSPARTDMSLTGSGNMTGITQCQAIWQDGYLS